MSMPTETPEMAAAPGAGNGVTDPSGQESVPQSEPTTAGPEEDRASDDRSEETLEERVRSFQSRYDKAAAENRQLRKQLGDEFQDWLPKLGGGDNVMKIVRHYASHPDFQKFIDELNRTGTISSPLVSKPAEEDDVYREPWEDAVAELRAENETLKREVLSTRAAQGSEKFTSHVKSWLGRYSELTDEEIERVRERGEATVRKLGADITKLSESDVNLLMRGTFTDDEWDALADRRALRRLQNQQQRGTDSPSPVSITGRESESLENADARNVWAEACRRIQ